MPARLIYKNILDAFIYFYFFAFIEFQFAEAFHIVY